MSVYVSNEVWRKSGARDSTLLVLLALADYAHDDGVAWATEATLAQKARITERQVRRTIKRLEEIGELELRKAQRGRRRCNVYRILTGLIAEAEVDYENLPFELDEPFGERPETPIDDRTSVVGGDSDDRTSVSPDDRTSVSPTRARDSLAEPSFKEPFSVPPEQSARARESGESVEVFEPSVQRLKQVDRKPVTAAEHALAVEVLAVYNTIAGQRFRSDGCLAKIIMRIREFPELSLADHREIIERQFSRPWWRGAASPSVIYGNDAIFERAVLVDPNSDGITDADVAALIGNLDRIKEMIG